MARPPTSVSAGAGIVTEDSGWILIGSLGVEGQAARLQFPEQPAGGRCGQPGDFGRAVSGVCEKQNPESILFQTEGLRRKVLAAGV